MTTKQLNTAQPAITLPTSGKAAIYIRPAAARETSIGSDIRELQTELIVKYARNAGWKDEDLVIFNDTGIPASASLEKREGLQALIRAIELDEIKAVLLNGAYSLYRDANFKDITYFMEVCRHHNILVVTPETVYDLNDPVHTRLFLFAIESADVSIIALTHGRSRNRGSKK